jgi:hypothetical protein
METYQDLQLLQKFSALLFLQLQFFIKAGLPKKRYRDSAFLI